MDNDINKSPIRIHKYSLDEFENERNLGDTSDYGDDQQRFLNTESEESNSAESNENINDENQDDEEGYTLRFYLNTTVFNCSVLINFFL